jgi:hypothetical protein
MVISTRRMLAAAMATLLMAGPAAALTINEGSFGGDFSNAFGSPSAIPVQRDVVNGTLGAGDYDFLAFTGMIPGAQTVTFNFSSSALGTFLSAGTVNYSTSPFTSNTSGTNVGTFVLFDAGVIALRSQSLTLNLGSGFAGTLYLMLNLATGPNVNYSLSIPGNLPPAPVPLPATALLLLGAGAGLGALKRAKGRKSAA